MVVECWVIILLILIMAYMIFRTGKAGQSVAVLPLVTVPLFHLLGAPLSRLISGVIPALSVALLRISVDIAGLMMACVLYGLLAGNMGLGKGRRVYMILCGGFSALLAIVLIKNAVVL